LTSGPGAGPESLRRVIGLPLLVFYGVGVTVGAGIFALIGEIIGIAGDLSPFVFLMAALLAGATAGSYAFLSRRFPKAAGAAVYAQAGFGGPVAIITGLGVVLTGVVSSAVIALAFGSYFGTLLPVPPVVLAVGLIALMAAIACAGVRQSVLVAAVITIVEVGTLLVVIAAGLPELTGPDGISRVVAVSLDMDSLTVVIAGATIAFYAFIGFEDIVNLAEEAKEPARIMPLAVTITLLVTTALYLAIATIAVAVNERMPIADSDAPMADLFAALTGLSPTPIAVIAGIAMINGVLIQIVMASRVLYGMASDGLIRPAWLAHIHPGRHTPVRATLLVAAMIGVLAAFVPLLSLAGLTSYVTLAVFTVVNLSLWRISVRSREPRRRFRAAWGLGAAALTLALLVADLGRRAGLIGS
jgi:amino acid transporter